MKQLILFLSFSCSCLLATAQYKPYYNVALGVRAGSTGATCGGTVKVFMGNSSALEGLVGYYKNGLSGTLLFEQHVELFSREEFQLYFGGGAHYSSSTEYQNWILMDSRSLSYEKAGSSFGFDVVAGLEYKFLGLPLAVSLDLKPAVDFNNNGGYALGLDQGLGLKLTF